MGIIFNEKTGEFHLYNRRISYIMKILRNGQMGQLYFGRRIHQKEQYDYLLENRYRPTTAYVYEGEYSFSLEHIKQEYPAYGTTDFRMPALEILQETAAESLNLRMCLIKSAEENLSFAGFRLLTRSRKMRPIPWKFFLRISFWGRN